jgi:hypothetical protein
MAINKQQAVLSPCFVLCEAIKDLLKSGKTKPVVAPATA